MADTDKIESMDDYLDELEQSFKRLREGDLVKGPVIGVGEVFHKSRHSGGRCCKCYGIVS